MKVSAWKRISLTNCFCLHIFSSCNSAVDAQEKHPKRSPHVPCGRNAPCQVLQLCKRSWKSQSFLLLLRSIRRYKCPQTALGNRPRYQLLSHFRWQYGLYDLCLCHSREERGICISVRICVQYVWLYNRLRTVFLYSTMNTRNVSESCYPCRFYLQ